MDEDLPAIDHGLRTRLDGDRPAEVSPDLTPQTLEPSSSAIDVGAIVEAVKLTAATKNALAERIQELEAHTAAFSASNDEFEAHNRQLVIELGDVIQQRDDVALSLQEESARAEQLEAGIARHVLRSRALERDLGGVRSDLERIVDAVGSHLDRASQEHDLT